jgi:hypothetical protein
VRRLTSFERAGRRRFVEVSLLTSAATRLRVYLGFFRRREATGLL